MSENGVCGHDVLLSFAASPFYRGVLLPSRKKNRKKRCRLKTLMKRTRLSPTCDGLFYVGVGREYRLVELQAWREA